MRNRLIIINQVIKYSYPFKDLVRHKPTNFKLKHLCSDKLRKSYDSVECLIEYDEEMHKIFTYVESADEEFFPSVHFRYCRLVPFTNLFSVPKDHDYFRGQ